MRRVLFASSLASALGAASIRLVTFDGAQGTTFTFTELNDPVMGGKSTGTWRVDKAGAFGVFDGEVVDVPSLKAPGFIKAAADGKFPDASVASGGDLVLMVRSSTPEYAGFRVTLASGTVAPAYACSGGRSIPLSGGCFKAKFSVPAGGEFVAVRIPLSDFSDRWSPATGEQTATCAQDPSACLTASKLSGVKRIEVWAEGVLGKAHLEMQAISVEQGQASSEVLAAAMASKVALATFDGNPATTFTFKALLDPVMGGKSSGTWTLNKAGKYGILDGAVEDVPSLSAPGFITAYASGTFPDASSAAGGSLVLMVRTSTPHYAGFRASFASGTIAPQYACAGGGSLPFSRGCFKSQRFNVPAGNDFVPIRLPLSSFSDKWSPSTGEQTTTCAQDASVCPSARSLAGIKRLEIWAEGAKGAVHIEVQGIFVEGAQQPKDHSMPSTRPSVPYDSCSAGVQEDLLFGIAGRTEPTVPVPVDAAENLAEAVCCDTRAVAFAEPQFLFEAPDIALFSKLDVQGVTTFYDSVCGIPVFRAPVNRSLDDFKSDTEEHGWPSFRSAEVVRENIITNKTSGFVTSACGTHLGTYLPDERGPRWCIDLSCIAGRLLADQRTIIL